MTEDHRAPNAGQLLRFQTRGHRERLPNEQAAQIACCWTVQNEMRSVRCQITAGAARKILDSVDSRQIRV